VSGTGTTLGLTIAQKNQTSGEDANAPVKRRLKGDSPANYMSQELQTRQDSKCGLATEVLRCFGEISLKATGTSMLPTIWPGDLLNIQFAEFEQVLPGDIVLYTRQNRFFIHRVTMKSDLAGERRLTMRGDAMAGVDPPVHAEELLGRVVAIRRGSNTIDFDRKLSAIRRMIGLLLGRCDLFCDLALRFQA